MTLQIGEKAPAFTLPNQDEENVSLSDFKGQWLVLYFYPRALTPGCTTQACSLINVQDEFKKLNATIIGVSPDKPSLLKKFETKKELNFQLISDETHEMLETYKAWGEKSLYGKKYMGVSRMTYIIDPEGKIAHVMPKVSPKTHTEDVLNWLRENAK